MNGFIVYKVENIHNGWVYIGSTTSTMEERKRDHVQKADNGTGHYFHQEIATFGPEAFNWEQIDTAETANELAAKEKDYILEYNSKEEGYNQDSGGGFKKIVYQYDMEGILQNTFESLSEAAKIVDVNKRSISAACLGKIINCKGFYWCYDLVDVYLPVADNRRKKVLQLDLDGNILNTYLSVAEASRQTGISKSPIAKTCRGEQEQTGGYFWKYSD